jgi:peptidoglycan hydrolase CwlO-like protein
VKEPIGELMRMGTIGSIFLSVLLIALVAFAIWARQLISSQLKMKDDRITHLESAVTELQAFNRTELMSIIADTQKMMQKSMDTFDRMENILKELKR